MAREADAPADDDHYRAILARDHPELSLGSFRLIGEGEDHRAFEADGGLIFRFPKRGRGAALVREARLLRIVGEASPLPVPRPAYLHRAHRYMGYRKLPGTPLISLLDDFAPRDWPGLGATIGGFLGAINAIPAASVAAYCEVEEAGLASWLDEARALAGEVGDHLPGRFAAVIAAFLAASPPGEPAGRVFAHNDLGAEHILVDPAARRVTGIIDWGDAALADPAYDLGKLYRDLGPAVLDDVLAHYPADGDAAALRERAIFYARCGVFEDLAYGLAPGHEAYARKSLAALAWLFPT